MSRLSPEKRVDVVAHLVEQGGIRSTSRLCKVDPKTVLSLLLTIGAGCERLHDLLVRNLAIWRIEMDELVAPLHTREIHLEDRDDEDPLWGHLWTFTAFATVSKLLLAFKHGKRTQDFTDAFVWSVRQRLTVIPEIVSDGMALYEAGIARSFGLEVDYAQLCKHPSRRGKVTGLPFVTRKRVVGAPDMTRVTTSGVERNNSTVRDQNKRYARKTRCHSKKIEYHEAQFALYAMWYNFVRIHSSLGTTPAVAAGLEREPWGLERLIEEALGAEEAPPFEPTPLKPREGTMGAARQTSTGGWLRALPGGKTKPGLASAPGGVKLTRGAPVKPAPMRPMKQLDLFDPE